MSISEIISARIQLLGHLLLESYKKEPKNRLDQAQQCLTHYTCTRYVNLYLVYNQQHRSYKMYYYVSQNLFYLHWSPSAPFSFDYLFLFACQNEEQILISFLLLCRYNFYCIIIIKTIILNQNHLMIHFYFLGFFHFSHSWLTCKFSVTNIIEKFCCEI